MINWHVFSEDYLPDKLLFREAQLKEAGFWIKSFIENGPKANLLFIGGPGLGKTASARLLAGEFNGIYINCWYFRKEFALLSELLRKLSIPVPEKGRRTEELIIPLFERAENKKIIVFLDEIDKLENFSALYELTRHKNIMVIGISNYRDFLARLDPRIRSSFSPLAIEFNPYSPGQIEEILKERLRLANADLDGERLRVISRLAYKYGSDIRLALKLLSATLLRNLEVNEIAELAKKIVPKEYELSWDLKKILEIIKKNPGIRTGELVEEFRKFKELSERSVRAKLKRLEELGLVKSREEFSGGHTKRWWIKEKS